jgi:bifunctional DNA-binding transcriptional regulator/antitoxin component of YhaV-PrlF toxin-antitoxin module
MSGAHVVTMGKEGRLVVPAELRESAGLVEGCQLVMLEAPAGVVLLTRKQAKQRVRADLGGLDLVSELLLERRQHAAENDAE